MSAYKLLLLFAFVMVFFAHCKKADKLENPFGLLQLDSDTTLPEGRYIIRTKYDCNGWARMLTSDYRDDIYDFSSSIEPNDDLSQITEPTIWYVKKVRYRSSDPAYRLAFGYRIFQHYPAEPNPYRFFSMSSTYFVRQWTIDEIGDGGGVSVVVHPLKKDDYPLDPEMPTSPGTSNDTTLRIEQRSLFQLYKSKETDGYWKLRILGGKEWKFCTAFSMLGGVCDGALRPHFRSVYEPDCKRIDNGSTRCYTDEFYFQKLD